MERNAFGIGQGAKQTDRSVIIPSSRSSSNASDNKFGCINPGSGGIMSGAENKRAMVSGAEEIRLKSYANKSCQIDKNDFNYNR